MLLLWTLSQMVLMNFLDSFPSGILITLFWIIWIKILCFLNSFYVLKILSAEKAVRMYPPTFLVIFCFVHIFFFKFSMSLFIPFRFVLYKDYVISQRGQINVPLRFSSASLFPVDFVVWMELLPTPCLSNLFWKGPLKDSWLLFKTGTWYNAEGLSLVQVAVAVMSIWVCLFRVQHFTVLLSILQLLQSPSSQPTLQHPLTQPQSRKYRCPLEDWALNGCLRNLPVAETWLLVFVDHCM